MKSIARQVENGEIEFTKHAYDQMMVRDIYIRQVHDVILNGKIVKKWQDRDCHKVAIVGRRFNGDSLKVVLKDVQPPVVITVCYPYENLE
jgi:hypothetical protein